MLQNRVRKTLLIAYLWEEEEKHGLCIVAEDARDGERHSREVAVGVPHEKARRVPIQAEKRQGNGCDVREQTKVRKKRNRPHTQTHNTNNTTHDTTRTTPQTTTRMTTPLTQQ